MAKRRFVQRRPARRRDDEPDVGWEAVEREVREADRRFSPLILGIFGGIGGLLLIIASVWAWSTAQALGREQSAPGKIVDLVERYSAGPSDSRGTAVPQLYYYPVVEFYTPDERRHTVQLGEGSWPPAYEKGQPVTVRYDPAQPLKARIDSPTGTGLQWIGPGIVGVVGIGFTLAALAAAWFLWPRSPAPPHDLASGR
jgi:hypothetical protein